MRFACFALALLAGVQASNWVITDDNGHALKDIEVTDLNVFLEFAQLDEDKTGFIEYGEFENLWEELAAENRRTVRRIGGTATVSYEVRGAAGAAGTATTLGEGQAPITSCAAWSRRARTRSPLPMMRRRTATKSNITNR